MKKVLKISIGIPAYNEAATIERLLRAVLEQVEEGFVLHEVIIMCDGSTDGTEKIAREVDDKRITVHHDGKRLGKSARLEQLFRTFSGDVLLLMDADIVIEDKHILSRIVRESTIQKDGVVAVNAQPLQPETFFQHALDTSVRVMKHITREWNHGNNYLACKGCFVALDGSFARSLHMPAQLVANDAYLYFAAKAQGYQPRYLEHLYAFYKSPTNLRDHSNQSSRHYNSRKEMEQYFDLDWEKEYTIPRSLLIKSTMKQLVTDPVHLLAYLGITLMTRMKRSAKVSSVWETAVSTKS